MKLSRAAGLACLLSLSICLQSQTPPGSQPEAATQTSASPVLKVTTRLVQVNVLVHDHHGQPIGDLSKDDFTVTDQGKPQRISIFSVEAAAAVPKTGTQPTVIPSNQFSNRFSQRDDMPTSATVILLDFTNTKFTDQVYAKQQVVKFLAQIQPEDRVALYQLTSSGFRVIHDFTNNPSALLASIAQAMPGIDLRMLGSEFDPANTGTDALDNSIDYANQRYANFQIRNRVIDTCLSLKVLADHLAGLPGRKSLVWVSGGFPMFIGYGDPEAQINMAKLAPNVDQEILTDYVEDASRALNNASVAVYPVDARGLLGLPMADASKNVKIVHGRLPSSMTHVDNSHTDTMQYVADLTGGKAFYNSNDIKGAIRKAIDDSAVTYTLGFYTSEENWDDRYHKIKVKVKRSGAEVRAKKGYFAERQQNLTDRDLTLRIRDAIWSPLDAAGVGLLASIVPSPTVPSASRILLKVSSSDISFVQDQGVYKANVDVLFATINKRGGVRPPDQRSTLNLQLKPDTYTRVMSEGLSAGRDVGVSPETESIKVIVLDRGTGQLGSVTIPVTKKDVSSKTLAAAGTGL